MGREVISKTVLINRLKKIEGQTRGLQRMIEEDRDCESILMPLPAVRSAFEGVGALVLNNYFNFCFSKVKASAPEEIDSLARSLAIWGRIKTKED